MTKKLSGETKCCEFFEGCWEFKEHGVAACRTHHCHHPNSFLGIRKDTTTNNKEYSISQGRDYDEEDESEDIRGVI